MGPQVSRDEARRHHARLVHIRTDVMLEGDLDVPDEARGLVIFAHGSGSSRRSARNRYVAQSFRSSIQVATLLMDLLSPDEDAVDVHTGEYRFDVPLLAERLSTATDFVMREPETRRLAIGYFGASTGAAAALVSAANRPNDVAAVVSRGGRPDLAGRALERVHAPTLFIVGGDDLAILDLNRAARARMTAPTALEVIPGATHLFEEPGALEDVARRASRWFARCNL